MRYTDPRPASKNHAPPSRFDLASFLLGMLVAGSFTWVAILGVNWPKPAANNPPAPDPAIVALERRVASIEAHLDSQPVVTAIGTYERNYGLPAWDAGLCLPPSVEVAP